MADLQRNLHGPFSSLDNPFSACDALPIAIQRDE
jgi:hypothetical protein